MNPHSTPTSPTRAPPYRYVLKVYPRFSETFIVTEILAREAQGEDLSIYALRPPRTRASTPRSPGWPPGSTG